MITNPYEPPQAKLNSPRQDSEDRVAALRALRTSLYILLVPGIYNFICFHFPELFSNSGFQVHELARVANLTLLCLTVGLIWIGGLALLERVAAIIHWALKRMLGSNSSFERWQAELHLALRRSPTLAFWGAILWIIWCLAIFSFHLDFVTVSLPIGIAAHLLAACLYVPLVYQWYKLEQSR
ncbi:MAG: hypothetical protein P8L85_05950 [Rubripirellula sp.]|nr:hypothetical protein [Rubripirellula sp.]